MINIDGIDDLDSRFSYPTILAAPYALPPSFTQRLASKDAKLLWAVTVQRLLYFSYSQDLLLDRNISLQKQIYQEHTDNSLHEVNQLQGLKKSVQKHLHRLKVLNYQLLHNSSPHSPSLLLLVQSAQKIYHNYEKTLQQNQLPTESHWEQFIKDFIQEQHISTVYRQINKIMKTSKYILIQHIIRRLSQGKIQLEKQNFQFLKLDQPIMQRRLNNYELDQFLQRFSQFNSFNIGTLKKNKALKVDQALVDALQQHKLVFSDFQRAACMTRDSKQRECPRLWSWSRKDGKEGERENQGMRMWTNILMHNRKQAFQEISKLIVQISKQSCNQQSSLEESTVLLLKLVFCNSRKHLAGLITSVNVFMVYQQLLTRKYYRLVHQHQLFRRPRNNSQFYSRGFSKFDPEISKFCQENKYYSKEGNIFLTENWGESQVKVRLGEDENQFEVWDCHGHKVMSSEVKSQLSDVIQFLLNIEKALKHRENSFYSLQRLLQLQHMYSKEKVELLLQIVKLVDCTYDIQIKKELIVLSQQLIHLRPLIISSQPVQSYFLAIQQIIRNKAFMQWLCQLFIKKVQGLEEQNLMGRINKQLRKCGGRGQLCFEKVGKSFLRFMRQQDEAAKQLSQLFNDSSSQFRCTAVKQYQKLALRLLFEQESNPLWGDQWLKDKSLLSSKFSVLQLVQRVKQQQKFKVQKFNLDLLQNKVESLNSQLFQEHLIIQNEPLQLFTLQTLSKRINKTRICRELSLGIQLMIISRALAFEEDNSSRRYRFIKDQSSGMFFSQLTELMNKGFKILRQQDMSPSAMKNLKPLKMQKSQIIQRLYIVVLQRVNQLIHCMVSCVLKEVRLYNLGLLISHPVINQISQEQFTENKLSHDLNRDTQKRKPCIFQMKGISYFYEQLNKTVSKNLLTFAEQQPQNHHHFYDPLNPRWLSKTLQFIQCKECWFKRALKTSDEPAVRESSTLEELEVFYGLLLEAVNCEVSGQVLECQQDEYQLFLSNSRKLKSSSPPQSFEAKQLQFSEYKFKRLYKHLNHRVEFLVGLLTALPTLQLMIQMLTKIRLFYKVSLVVSMIRGLEHFRQSKEIPPDLSILSQYLRSLLIPEISLLRYSEDGVLQLQKTKLLVSYPSFVKYPQFDCFSNKMKICTALFVHPFNNNLRPTISSLTQDPLSSLYSQSLFKRLTQDLLKNLRRRPLKAFIRAQYSSIITQFKEPSDINPIVQSLLIQFKSQILFEASQLVRNDYLPFQTKVNTSNLNRRGLKVCIRQTGMSLKARQSNEKLKLAYNQTVLFICCKSLIDGFIQQSNQEVRKYQASLYTDSTLAAFINNLHQSPRTTHNESLLPTLKSEVYRNQCHFLLEQLHSASIPIKTSQRKLARLIDLRQLTRVLNGFQYAIFQDLNHLYEKKVYSQNFLDNFLKDKLNILQIQYQSLKGDLELMQLNKNNISQCIVTELLGVLEEKERSVKERLARLRSEFQISKGDIENLIKQNFIAQEQVSWQYNLIQHNFSEDYFKRVSLEMQSFLSQKLSEKEHHDSQKVQVLELFFKLRAHLLLKYIRHKEALRKLTYDQSLLLRIPKELQERKAKLMLRLKEVQLQQQIYKRESGVLQKQNAVLRKQLQSMQQKRQKKKYRQKYIKITSNKKTMLRKM